MSADQLDLGDVREYLRRFAEERDWVQYHTPKNLAMAIAVESSELLEIFQWMTPEESTSLKDLGAREAVEDEVADVLQYLVRLADVLEIDLDRALWAKLKRNQARFPV